MKLSRSQVARFAVSRKAALFASGAALFALSACGAAAPDGQGYDPNESSESAMNYEPPTGGGSGGETGEGSGGEAGGGSGGDGQDTPDGVGGRQQTGGAGGNGIGGQGGDAIGGQGGDGIGGQGGDGIGGQGGGGGNGEQDLCGNDRDDDNDGSVDELCDEPVVCEDTEGNNCNGDMGYGDHCAPEDNTNGCTPERFWAWCNRRNSQYPNIWDDYLRRWVVGRCDGEVSLQDTDDDGYETFVCTDSMGRRWECTTPLVLSFDPLGHVSVDPSAHRFPLGSGAVASDWPRAETPWLVLDRNGNGRIDDGAELFGSSTLLASGRTASNGFEALADLDGNRDGTLDAADGAWAELALWTDRDGDGVSQASELVPAADAGLQGIDLAYRVSTRCDERGNCERERSTFSWRDGRGTHHGAVIDIYLRHARD